MHHHIEMRDSGAVRPHGFLSYKSRRAHCVRGRHLSALTLIEVMIAVTMFAILMAGALVAVLQTRRMAENNIGMAVARTVAQGIIEQARLESPVIREPGASSLPIRFIGTDSMNFAAISQRQLPIETDPDVWTRVGALKNPADPSSEILGVLLDVQQKDALGNVIRPAKYMEMEVNFRVTANESVRRYAAVELRYRWKSPVRRTDGSDHGWITREVRTAIPFATNI
jgi:type II secretory pathway pseudopilin PulG